MLLVVLALLLTEFILYTKMAIELTFTLLHTQQKSCGLDLGLHEACWLPPKHSSWLSRLRILVGTPVPQQCMMITNIQVCCALNAGELLSPPDLLTSLTSRFTSSVSITQSDFNNTVLPF